jgi:hypothetical protein
MVRREENAGAKANEIVIGQVVPSGFLNRHHDCADCVPHRLRDGPGVVVMNRDVNDGGVHDRNPFADLAIDCIR